MLRRGTVHGESLRRGLGFVFPVNGLGDQSLADGLGRHLDADDAAVDDGANALNVGLEFARGDAGDLGADAAQVFGLAAMGDLVTKGGLFSGVVTNTSHCQTSLVQKESSRVYYEKRRRAARR